MSNFFIVLRKELTDIIRDKKTLAFTVILPILIFPVLFKIMSVTMESKINDVQNEINIVVNGDIDSKLGNILNSQSNIKIRDYKDDKKALKDGDIQLIVNIPEDVDNKILNGEAANIEFLIDDQSEKSSLSASVVESLFNEYSENIVEQRLSSLNVDSSILEPITIETKSGISDDGTDNSSMNTILGMIPALIVILLLSPTIGLSADLGAGEKERGTFEPLLSTSVNRNSILWGKIASISIVLLVTLILTIISLVFSFKDFVGTISDAAGAVSSINLNINIMSILYIILFCIFIIIFVSTLQVGVSMYARSSKEANTYLTGLIMPIMLLAFIPLYLDVKSIDILFFNIPIVNAICVMKEVMIGIYNTTHILIVLAWHIIYVVGVLIGVKLLFSREEVVFRS